MTFDLDRIEDAAKAAVPRRGHSTLIDAEYLSEQMQYPVVLALVEVVRAAQNFIATYNNATTLTDTTDARIVLIAALKPFGDAA